MAYRRKARRPSRARAATSARNGRYRRRTVSRRTGVRTARVQTVRLVIQHQAGPTLPVQAADGTGILVQAPPQRGRARF